MPESSPAKSSSGAIRPIRASRSLGRRDAGTRCGTLRQQAALNQYLSYRGTAQHAMCLDPAGARTFAIDLVIVEENGFVRRDLAFGQGQLEELAVGFDPGRQMRGDHMREPLRQPQFLDLQPVVCAGVGEQGQLV